MNRNFFLLWQGQLISQIGNQISTIAMLFWLKQTTGSATLIGLIMMASALPSVLLGPIAGTFADRYSRRTIIICCDLFAGLMVLSQAGLLFIAPRASDFIIVWLFVMSSVVAIIDAFFKPAISAAIPDILPEDKVASGNSLNQASVQIATLIGQGLGGVLFQLLGAPMLFLINGLSYLFTATSESFITIPQTLPKKSNSWKKAFNEFQVSTVEGFHYIWSRAGIKAIFLAAAALNVFAVTIFVLLPFYVEGFLKAGASLYGFLWAAFGVGSLLGYILISIIKFSGKARIALLSSSLLGSAFAFGSLGFTNSPSIALVIMAMLGMMIGIINVIAITILQITIPSEIRGRVFSLLITLSSGLNPIAMGLSGIIADLTNHNIPLIYTTCGGLLILLSLWLLMNQKVHEFFLSA
ncbi:MAG: MFS transporter [Chroococcidiopsidaceae cyanobacterium CP_BM_RX_35]|nr:MFS transporter [Chroococcidiopsidaceae cyanobacterium CP_BM_RX_35]